MRLFHLNVICIFFYSSAFAQNIGIGTTMPKARLHIADSNVLFTGLSNLPAISGLAPASGAGTRFMWYANKAALRAGGVSGTHWDELAVGNYSAAFGYNNRAAGEYAASIGWGNSSAGKGAFTVGFSNTATGNYAVGIGTDVDAQAYASLVIGRYNVIAGSTTSWVDNDPLFIIGNGYQYDAGNGSFAIKRRNAFTVSKLGNTMVGGEATFLKKTQFDDTTLFNQNVGINLSVSETPSTSLSIAGALSFKRTIVGINAANNYTINVLNQSLVEVSYTEDYTIVPTIKLSTGGYSGQILILTNSGGYSFKVASVNSTPSSAWIAVPSTRTIKGLDTIVLLYHDFYWKELSYSSNH